MSDLNQNQTLPPSERTYSSGSVKRIKYLKDKNILEVEFPNGSTYHYKEVPETLWKELFKDPSPGKFISDKIKNHYEYIKVK